MVDSAGRTAITELRWWCDGTGGPCGDGRPLGTMLVMSLNIWHHTPPWPTRMRAMSDLIARQRPHVVALQEVRYRYTDPNPYAFRKTAARLAPPCTIACSSS